MGRADRHNEIELNFLPRRLLIYLIGGNRVVVPRGRLAVFWAATPHQVIEYATSAPYFVATIPLAWFLMWRLPQIFTQRILAGELVCDPDCAGAEDDERQFARWAADFRSSVPEQLRATALEIEARLRRLALACDEPLSEQHSPLAGRRWEEMSKLEQMAAWIAQHYTGQALLEDIGKAVDLHPNYAANLYRKGFGTTLSASIQAHRVAHAQRLLVVSDTKILDVALQSGFNSLSRFNVAFKRTCGCTPREYRRRHLLSA